MALLAQALTKVCSSFEHDLIGTMRVMFCKGAAFSHGVTALSRSFIERRVGRNAEVL